MVEMKMRIARALDAAGYHGGEESIFERLDEAPAGSFDCNAFWLVNDENDTPEQRIESFIAVRHGCVSVHSARVQEELENKAQRVLLDSASGRVIGTMWGEEFWRRVTSGGFASYGYPVDVAHSINDISNARGETVVLSASCGAGACVRHCCSLPFLL